MRDSFYLAHSGRRLMDHNRPCMHSYMIYLYIVSCLSLMALCPCLVFFPSCLKCTFNFVCMYTGSRTNLYSPTPETSKLPAAFQLISRVRIRRPASRGSAWRAPPCRSFLLLRAAHTRPHTRRFPIDRTHPALASSLFFSLGISHS